MKGMTTAKQYKKMAEEATIDELISATEDWIESSIRYFDATGPCFICGSNPYVLKRLLSLIKEKGKE